jgi:hypothetical protein
MNQRSTRDGPQLRANLALARRLWTGRIRGQRVKALEALFREFRFSIAASDLQLLDGRWYVTHAGLLRLACRRKCLGIKTALQKALSDPISNRWVFKATVYTAPASRGFVGYGDADPSNVSVRGAEMRVAETRAVNRALRKAYGIGLCSVEELGSFYGPVKSSTASPQANGPHGANGSNNGQPRLRDRLCLLIRQYNLDPTLVKAYAADFCGTQTLKDASRELIESFVSQLAAAAKNDRDGLICKLNSYAQPAEGKP